MCGCKDCKGITLFKGADGRGIVSITDNGDGTLTVLYTDGTIYITPDFTGPQGIQGPQGPQGDPGINGTNGTDGVIILHSVHPKDSSIGVAQQVLGDPNGYTLVEWGIVASGTVIEMEFDLHTEGTVLEPIPFGKVGFLLNESLTYIPELIFGDLPIPLVEDEYQALNIKITLTKNTNTEGYISLEATRISSGSHSTIFKVWGMSEFITLSTGPGTVERIEVLVNPDSNPIILDRVIIKQINP
jgi:hypothetical protein